MSAFRRTGIWGLVWLVAAASPLHAERLALTFLPPDLPPSNVCNADPEVREEGELQDGDLQIVEPGEVVLEDDERIRLLSRDIQSLTRENAVEWGGFIEALIDWKAGLDPSFAGPNEAFARADLLIAAGRFSDLKNRGLFAEFATDTALLSNAQKVHLARHLRMGLAVEKDKALADKLLIEAGFSGNSAGLLAIVRLQMAGDPIEGWDLPVAETATLAFGGVIGQINRGICGRAERMAREYLAGDILEPNEGLAYAWRVFAADMGGARAAWRVVEHHLNGTAPHADHDALLRYLSLAVASGFSVGPEDVATLEQSGAVSEEELRDLLKKTPENRGAHVRRSASRYLELGNNPIVDGLQADSDARRYLNEVLTIPGAPGVIYTRLAREVLVRDGRWRGEAEAIGLLKDAVQLGDPEAMVLLARLKSRYRGDPATLNTAEELLLDAVSQHSHAPAMRALDDFYRCRVPAAPLRSEATFWAKAYRATGEQAVSASSTDVAKFDATFEPDIVAQIQSDALRGHAASKANLLQMLQSNPAISSETLRYWASRVASSDSALEEFVNQEFELALTVGDRGRAISLFRRAYLDVGQSISLDLAVALVEHAGRDEKVAREIEDLLRRSGSRGEGAAIRLLQRLTNSEPNELYATYADIIERRGDFLGMMFAAPFISDGAFEDYMGRAVSEMNCSSKDVAELADAYAARGLHDEATRWLQVGLAMEGGHLLSKLGLTDRQGDAFASGTPELVFGAKNDLETARKAYLAASDSRGDGFEIDAAAEQLRVLLEGTDPEMRSWALGRYQRADRRVQQALRASFNVMQAFELGAMQGDPNAQYSFAMMLRQEAKTPEDLSRSAELLLASAQAGQAAAMVEYGFALGFGLGVERDEILALIWLQKAQSLGSDRARELAHMIKAMESQ